MNNKVKQKFLGCINDVEILDSQLYFYMCSFIGVLENKYKISIEHKEITEIIEIFISDILEHNTRIITSISLTDIEEYYMKKDIDYLLNRNNIEYNKYDLEYILNKVKDIKLFKDRSIETKGK